MTTKPSTGNPNRQDDCEYTKKYHDIDFRREPHRYAMGRGEQGVFMTKPYSTEIRDHWRFRTPEIAEASAKKIFGIFQSYVNKGDFVGADVARKFLMMGWTRSRRYANHASGTKWENGKVRPFEADQATSAKADSARIFKKYYDDARTNAKYLRLKATHKVTHSEYLERK